MKVVFKDVLEEYLKEDEHTENIAVQNDEEFQAEMDKLTQDLYDNHKMLGNPKGVDASRHHELNDKMDILSKFLKDRFGLPIKLLYSDDLAYVMPLSGSNSSIIDVDRSEIVDVITELQQNICVDGSCKEVDFDKDINDIDLMYSNKVIFKLTNDMQTMNKLFAKGAITVDFEKAKVTGLMESSSKLVTPIGVNVGGLISMGATVRQIASIVLHEVGHQFNTIAYTDTLCKSALTPLQAIADGKNSHTRKKIAMEEFGSLIDNDETKLYKLPDILVNKLTPIKGVNSAFFNNEITADQFAARLGYGEEVVTSLNEFHFSSEREDPMGTLFMATGLLILNVVIGLNVSFTPLVILTLIQTTMTIVAISSLLFITALVGGRSMNLWDEHEQSFARTRRIRLELIRQLRTHQVKGDTKRTIDSIIRLGGYLEQHAQSKTFPMVLFSWMTGASKEIGTHERNTRVEQLMENELHLIKARRKG